MNMGSLSNEFDEYLKLVHAREEDPNNEFLNFVNSTLKFTSRFTGEEKLKQKISKLKVNLKTSTHLLQNERQQRIAIEEEKLQMEENLQVALDFFLQGNFDEGLERLKRICKSFSDPSSHFQTPRDESQRTILNASELLSSDEEDEEEEKEEEEGDERPRETLEEEEIALEHNLADLAVAEEMREKGDQNLEGQQDIQDQNYQEVSQEEMEVEEPDTQGLLYESSSDEILTKSFKPKTSTPNSEERVTPDGGEIGNLSEDFIEQPLNLTQRTQTEDTMDSTAVKTSCLDFATEKVKQICSPKASSSKPENKENEHPQGSPQLAFKRKASFRVSNFLKKRAKSSDGRPTHKTEASGSGQTTKKTENAASSTTMNEFKETVVQDDSKKAQTQLTCSNSGNNIKELRPHNFEEKYIYSLNQQCQICNEKLLCKVAEVCNTCQATAHAECAGLLNLPCIATPGKHPRFDKKVKYDLADFVTDAQPKVPYFIAQCTNEIEKRGLEKKGLYRVTGRVRQVTMIMKQFNKGHGLPNLAQFEVAVLTSLIKEFLNGLREPLISPQFWQNFILAAKQVDSVDQMALLYHAVSELHQPNRDTLAWMILHLQRVAISTECLMDAKNLSIVLGPTLCGVPPVCNNQKQFNEYICDQQKIIELLIELPSDYWEQYAKSSQLLYINGDKLG